MCSSGVGFDPVVDGETYTFDVYGLYNGLFVMSDRQTGSVWTHYDGTVLQGPLAAAGVSLAMTPIVHTTWSEWVANYPDSLVLDWYEEFASRYRHIEPGGGGLGPQFQATILNWDDRLPQNELVLGVGLGDAFRAYVLADLGNDLAVLNDQLSGQAVVVMSEGKSGYALAFSREFDGEVLEFAVVEGQIVDQHGRRWLHSGMAADGSAGLTFVTSFVTEWYGWAAYHPETEIWGG